MPWGWGEQGNGVREPGPCSHSGEDVPHPAAPGAASSGACTQASSARHPFACGWGPASSSGPGGEGGQRLACSRPSMAPHMSGDGTRGPSAPRAPGVRAGKPGRLGPPPSQRYPGRSGGQGGLASWALRLLPHVGSWEAGPGLPSARRLPRELAAEHTLPLCVSEGQGRRSRRVLPSGPLGAPCAQESDPSPPLSDVWVPDPAQGPDQGPEQIVGVTWCPSGCGVGKGDAKGVGVASETGEK